MFLLFGISHKIPTWAFVIMNHLHMINIVIASLYFVNLQVLDNATKHIKL